MSNPPRALGRRKTAIAHVELVTGGSHTVNTLPLADYLSTVAMQQAAVSPLVVTSQDKAYGIRARVSGGGKRGQADAVKLGVARALLVLDPGFRKQLKEAGMLTRDPRMKERKKPGLKSARRAPQFSKR